MELDEALHAGNSSGDVSRHRCMDSGYTLKSRAAEVPPSRAVPPPSWANHLPVGKTGVLGGTDALPE